MRLQLARRAALTAANAVVVVTALGGSADAEPAGETETASDVLVYTDTDNVVVVSPQIAVRHELDEDGGEVSARYVLDAISAASVDVVSSATYRFSELRNEVGLSLSKSAGEWLPQMSYRYSHEPDYQSHGLTVGVARRLAGGDTTLSVTVGAIGDKIGRVGTADAAFSEELGIQTFETSVTQNIDKQTLVRVVYSLIGQSGYMEKPYRSVPLFDQAGLAAANAQGGLTADNYEQFRLAPRPLEEVPDVRIRHAIAARTLRFIDAIDSSVKLDYRFYFDSWGMTAHTIEPALHMPVLRRWRLDAWTRLHWQSSASFWQRAFVVDRADQIPALRSSDRSLARSWHATGGFRTTFTGKSFSTYFEFSTMYSRFNEFLFLDRRTALISQAGFRWRF